MRTACRTATSARVLVTLAALACAASPGPAAASPPTPLVTKLADLARARAVEGGRFVTPPGTDTVTAAYSFAPHSASAWTDRRADSVLAVTEGILTLRAAEGCTEKQYRAGEAAVVPAGSYQIVNSGGDTLEFAGVFANLSRAAGEPFTSSDGSGAACRRTGRAAPEVSDRARGTFVPVAAYGNSLHAREAGGITIEPGTDVLVSSFTFQPGFSSGWYTHQPGIVVITKGTFAYYEGRDEGCVKSEEYRPGQAYTHVGGIHMGVVEGDQPVEMVTTLFNLPHDSAMKMVPAVGNTLDGIDFTPLPPAECPRLS